MPSCHLCPKAIPALSSGLPLPNIVTNHVPLQWLSAKKMQGLLCRWALAIQEYNYNIYRKGPLNANADALSCCYPSPTTATTVVLPQLSTANIRQAQEANTTVPPVLHARLTSTTVPDAPCWKAYIPTLSIKAALASTAYCQRMPLPEILLSSLSGSCVGPNPPQ